MTQFGQSMPPLRARRRRPLVASGLAAALVAAAAGPAAAGDWAIVSVNGHPAQGDAEFTFNADATLSGSTGCNRFSATAQFESGWMVIDGPVATTRMACPGDALTVQEERILSVFENGFSITYDPFAETLKLTGRTATILLAPPVADPSPQQQAITPDPAVPAEDRDAAELPAAEAGPPPEAPPDDVKAPTLFNTAYVAVHGLSGRLNVRAEASTGAKIVGGVQAGALLSNKGCEEQSDRTWCHVAHIGNGRPQGWVAAEYLKPAPAALRASESLFDGIGTLGCVSAGSEAAICDYGVAHDPDGTAAMTVFLADGSEQLLVFRNGVLLPDAGAETDAERVGDRVVVEVGAVRLDFPAAVISPE